MNCLTVILKSFIYNNQVAATQRMLDFDYASGRETPSVAAIINPTGSDSFSKVLLWHTRNPNTHLQNHRESRKDAS